MGLHNFQGIHSRSLPVRQVRNLRFDLRNLGITQGTDNMFRLCAHNGLP
jgi:hypothetical protein